LLRVQPAGFKLSRPRQAELYAVSSDSVANVFRAKIQNKDDVPRRFFVEAEASPTKVSVLNQSAGLVIAPQAEITLPLTLLVDRRDYRGEFNFTLRLRSLKHRLFQRPKRNRQLITILPLSHAAPPTHH
jgi:hypothetical protein